MTRDLVDVICANLPGVEVPDPFVGGHNAWKGGGQMFACIGAKAPFLSDPGSICLGSVMRRSSGTGYLNPTT
jgi:hypothetical protein